jgi:hypothetical protein
LAVVCSKKHGVECRFEVGQSIIRNRNFAWPSKPGSYAFQLLRDYREHLGFWYSMVRGGAGFKWKRDLGRK